MFVCIFNITIQAGGKRLWFFGMITRSLSSPLFTIHARPCGPTCIFNQCIHIWFMDLGGWGLGELGGGNYQLINYSALKWLLCCWCNFTLYDLLLITTLCMLCQNYIAFQLWVQNHFSISSLYICTSYLCY